MSHCPRCGEELAAGQAYCVECGLRLPGSDAVGVTSDAGSGWVPRSLVLLVVAILGGAAAVAATGGSDNSPRMLTAVGGFARTPGASTVSPGGGRGKVAQWPPGQEGWTITLVSLPQTGGKSPALSRAREARKRGLPSVGVLDSSRYASLHPGYWVVFTGVYSSEAEATSELEAARAFTRSASVRRIVP